jgi:hypothetical protein
MSNAVVVSIVAAKSRLNMNLALNQIATLSQQPHYGRDDGESRLQPAQTFSIAFINDSWLKE